MTAAILAASPALVKAEREVILTIADDEDAWHVHTDSRRAFSGRLLKLAKAWGVTPERVGAGYQFRLPLKASWIGKPPSAARIAHGRRLTARSEAKSRPTDYDLPASVGTRVPVPLSR